MTPPRLTSEHETKIRASFRAHGQIFALDTAYLLDELDAVRKERDMFQALLPDGHLPGHRRHEAAVARAGGADPLATRRLACGWNNGPDVFDGGPVERCATGKPATFTNCQWTPPLAVCEDHKCRCPQPIQLALPESPIELMTCRHIWEADDQGVQCCALCGATAK